MKFMVKEHIEVAEREGRWGLLDMGEVAPVEVGLYSAIRVVIAEVWFKQVGVRKRQC